MTCQQCDAPCQGGLCRQCEIENAHAHRADEVASDSVWDHDDETEGDDDSPGHGDAVLAQLKQAERDGDLPADIVARHEEVRWVTMSEDAAAVASRMTEEDWLDIMDSEFVDYVEGRRSFGLVFDHNEIGLHGLKFDPAKGVLRPVAFSKKGDDTEVGDDE